MNRFNRNLKKSKCYVFFKTIFTKNINYLMISIDIIFYIKLFDIMRKQIYNLAIVNHCRVHD